MTTLNRLINLSLKNNKILTKKSNLNFNNKYRLSCILTKRNRAIFKNYKLSRVCFRDLADSGYIAGIKRSCW